MQFRYLAFGALGPFPGTHTINFDELTAGGLFLFDGPTGSGKSSIIDAIVFALYGKVAGAESDDSRIRSAHADDSTPSYADLVFTIPSGIYRVRRSPGWYRTKKRGEGLTPQNPTATLWKLSEAAVDSQAWDAGDVLASGARNVGTELSQLLALTREQFVQTVVLPQGQFAQFLRLSSIDRSALLETLFDTTNYRAFAQKLTKMAKVAGAKVDEAGAEATRALQSWCDIDGLASEFPDSETLEFIDADDSAPLESMAAIDEQLSARATGAEAQARELKTSADQATKKRLAEEALAKALDDRAALLRRSEELRAQVKEVAAKRSQIDLHEKVSTAVDRLATASRARASLDASAADLPAGVVPVGAEHGALAEAIADGRELAELAGALVAATDGAIGEITAQVGSLDAVVDLEESLTGRTKALAKLDDTAQELAEEIASLTRELDEFPARMKTLDADIVKARAEADTIASLDAELTALKERLERVEKLQALRAEREAATKDAQEALGRHQDQRDLRDAVTAAWIGSTAANLAATLAEQEPCPVCGSPNHPAPAQPTDDSATYDDVQEAEAALEPLALALQKANAAVQKLTGQEETLSVQAGNVSERDLADSITSTTAKLDAAQAAKAKEKTLATQRTELTDANNKRLGELGTLREEQSSLSERIKNAREALNKDEASIARARGDFESVSALRDSLLNQQSKLVTLKESAHTIAERARHARSAQLAAEESLATAGVSHIEAREAHLDADTLATLKRTVDQHGKDVAAIDAQLAHQRFEGLTGEEKPDVEGASQKEDAATTKLRAAEAESTLAQSRARASTRHLERTRQAVAGWKAADKAAGPVVRLAALANADSTSLNKIRLSTWVLLRRFEQIVDRANEHLREFSFGRYELERTDESGAERKTGLGLEIIHRDAGPQGDHRRSTRTLSGGETFYTSLALALALSEVVQAENGGIRMETLIIDEGFGALSSEYLQSIMDTLGQLRTGGRTVGIVSHVDELKSMINDRVTVRPLPEGGSTLKVVAGN